MRTRGACSHDPSRNTANFLDQVGTERLRGVSPQRRRKKSFEKDIEMREKIALVKGSGNVFRDFHYPTADVEQLKSILAAKIIAILDERELSVRKAEGFTGVKASEFSRIRNAHLDRFTVDRLMTILNRRHCRVEVKVSVKVISPLSTHSKDAC
jgi:predicted XRE-type DNA-binding protein